VSDGKRGNRVRGRGGGNRGKVGRESKKQVRDER